MSMEPRYTPKDFDTLWGLEHKYQTWFNVEYAVYKEMVDQKIIHSQQSSEWLEENHHRISHSIDVDAILAIERDTKHDVVAFLKWLETKTLGRTSYFHFGMTSSDLVDTSFSIIILKALDIVRADMIDLITDAHVLADANSGVRMMGRTHGMHAQPITVAHFLYGHISELQRALSSLEMAKEKIAYGKISGPVGNYGNISPDVELNVLKNLGLTPEDAATQVIPRDRHLDVIYSLAKCAVALERLATNIRHLARSEVQEMMEGFSGTQKGSSSMPHKKNPITCETICGISRIVRSFVTPAFESTVLWHERDISHSSVERLVFPQATAYTSFIIRSMKDVLKNIHINKDSMEEKVQSNLSWMSESFMMKLIKKGYSRSDAHKHVQDVMESLEPISAEFTKRGLLTQEECESCLAFSSAAKYEKLIAKRVRNF